MEPVKGGALAAPIPQVQALFKAADPDASFASWAIRYAASLDGVITVLSGMSNLAQTQDNLSYMKAFRPLNEEERAVIAKAQAELRKDASIPCTACHYCTDGCPMNIPIPEIFAVCNRQKGKEAYDSATAGKGKASDCIACGQCESACPQQLPITEYLQSAAKRFE